MEQIQSHEIKDIYRVKNGLLVEVNKYKRIGTWDSSKRPEKRVKGCKGLTVLKEDYKIYKAGTYFFGSSPVEPTTNPLEFTFEVKSSGGSIAGDLFEMTKILEDIQNLLKTY